MRRRQRWGALVCLAVGLASSASADSLARAYSAILKGDYAAGKAEITRLMSENESDDTVRRIGGWLSKYQSAVSTRDDLRSQTFDWNVSQAREQMAAGKTFVALVFAAQATAYAKDEAAYREEPWLRELREKALADAAEARDKSNWARALAHYARLQRIYEKDDSIERLRKQCAQLVRMEALYKDRQAVEKRTRGVTPALVRTIVRAVHDHYYEAPDFRKLGEGAIDQLIAMTHARKLHDVFDGLGSAELREHFVSSLEQRRQRVLDKPRFDYRDLIALFDDVLRLNDGSVDVDDNLLTVEFVEGALGRLDEYTTMIWPTDGADWDKAMGGTFRGVGIQLGRDEKTERLKVVTPLENSPALEAGIQPDDLIVEVDGDSTRGWSTEDAITRITGEEGTKVVLTILRPSTNERFRYTLTRRPIHMTSVRGVNRIENSAGEKWNYLLDSDAGIAYIRLTGFNPESQKELDAALDSARQQGMRGLILDLRYNPGGLLDVAVSTVSTFLERGEVVSTNGRAERKQTLKAFGEATLPELPLIVLVNEGSASASEILSGALQDHNRAVVLGDRTFGKGSVQKLLPVSPQARLKLTTALYFLPSGRTPHKKPDETQWGVDPDVVVGLTPKELSKIIERESRAFVIHNGRKDQGVKVEESSTGDQGAPDRKNSEDGDDVDELLSETDLTLLRSDPFKAPDADPQLETALLHLRVKLAGNMPWPRQLAARPAERDAKR